MNELYKCFNPECDFDLFEELSTSDDLREEIELDEMFEEFNY